MFVIPVTFNKEHKKMLAHTKELMEYQTGHMAINPRHSKLITALRTVVEMGEGTLDTESTSHDDLIDSFQNILSVLALKKVFDEVAVEKGDGSLDKDATSFDDCFDALRLSLQFWH